MDASSKQQQWTKHGSVACGWLSRNFYRRHTGIKKAVKRFLKKMLKHNGKYQNNIVEQDHRFVKRKMKQAMGFEIFNNAGKTIKRPELLNISIGFAKRETFSTFERIN